MKVGDHVKVTKLFGQYAGKTGIVVAIEKSCPDVTVMLDEHVGQVPELGYRFFWQSELEVID